MTKLMAISSTRLLAPQRAYGVRQTGRPEMATVKYVSKLDLDHTASIGDVLG